MDIEEYDRKPFTVKAVQVTFENTEEIAKWCDGEAGTAEGTAFGRTMNLPCVKITGPGNTVTVAMVGDWVTDRKGFRVFGNKQFASMFQKKVKPNKRVLGDVNKNVFTDPAISHNEVKALVKGLTEEAAEHRAATVAQHQPTPSASEFRTFDISEEDLPKGPYSDQNPPKLSLPTKEVSE